MDDQQFHREQLQQFQRVASTLKHWAAEDGNETLGPLAEAFDELAKQPQALHDDAPDLVYRLFTTAPAFAQGFPRDLLWYLGGQCLHFMPDDEIERWCALDEDRRAAAARGLTFDWHSAAASAGTVQ